MTFDARKTNIHQLLGSSSATQLRVPDFQRGYSWENSQVSAFLNDIGSFADGRRTESEQEYFLGPIVLMSGPTLSGHCYIIDGQQRIATAQILLSSIRDAAAELTDTPTDARDLAESIQATHFSTTGTGGGQRATLRLGDLDERFFSRTIQRFPRDAQLVARCTSEGLILRARNQADRWLRSRLETSSEPPIEELRGLYEALTRHTALVSIEVSTDRQAMEVFERINCRGVELAETDLILHRMMVSCNSRTERRQVRRAWSQLDTMLGDLATLPTFFGHLWSAIRGHTGSLKLYELTSQYINEHELSSLEFIEECHTYCAEYCALLVRNSNNLHHQSRDSVWAIHKHLDGRQALPFLLAAYHRLGRSPEFSRVASACESLIVRHKHLAGNDASELRGALLGAINAINDARNNGEAVDAAIAGLQTIDPSDAQITDGSQRDMKLSSRVAKHILRGIEDHYAQGAYRADGTLEHIFPRNPSPAWSHHHRAVLRPYLNHLGNLTLLTDDDNKRASNRGYGDKKRLIYETATLKITRDITEHERWSRTAVLRRARDLARAATRRWQVR